MNGIGRECEDGVVEITNRKCTEQLSELSEIFLGRIEPTMSFPQCDFDSLKSDATDNMPACLPQFFLALALA